MVDFTDYDSFQEYVLTGESLGVPFKGEYDQVISIVDTPDPVDGEMPPPGGWELWDLLPQDFALRLVFDDVPRDDDDLGRVAPTSEDVQKIIDFARKGPPKGRMLVHCSAGVSRSSATALVCLCAKGMSPQEAISICLSSEHSIHPHRRIVSLGDRLLGLGGALLRARDERWGISLAPI